MPGAKSTITQKLANPEAHFPSPAAVAEDAKLSTGQKRAALAIWEQDARQLAVATEEGMAGGQPARLDEVKAAQGSLPGLETAAPSSPAKTG